MTLQVIGLVNYAKTSLTFRCQILNTEKNTESSEESTVFNTECTEERLWNTEVSGIKNYE